MAKPWNRFPQKRKDRKIKARILIVCEGSKTEPYYFRAFHVTSVKVKVVGTGYNTESLIKEAIRLRNEADTDEQYDQVWCVFDKDNFPKKNVEDAFDLAKKEQIKVAYSNQCFELWYYLHFSYHDAALHRNDYIEKLSGKLGFRYQKNDKNMYEHLFAKQKDALKNAKKLTASYGDEVPAGCDPYTSVYLLVEELNKNSGA